MILLISFSFIGCNLVKWNQNRLTKKYARKDVQQKVFDNDKYTVNYWEGGEGETVVLVHGFGADGQMTWNKSIQDLVKDYHVIVPDLLWFGNSYSEEEANLDSQVNAMLSLLEDREVKKCNLVGISYGGFVSLGISQKAPELIEKLCIVDSPGLTYNLDLIDSLCLKVGVDEVQDIFVVKDAQGVKRLFNLASYKNKRIPKGILKDTYEVYFDQHHKQLYQLLETLPAEQKRFLTHSDIKFPPTTIIWGVDDQVFPLSEGERLADYMNAELKIVEKAGHAPNLDNYKQFQKYLKEFLAE